MRRLHRYLAVFAILFGLYVAGTGVFLQMIDLQTLLSHAPADDRNLMAIREGRDGPPNFKVNVPSDFTAPALPGGFDYAGALTTVLGAARAAAAGAPFRFVELRMADGRPVGQVDAGGRLLRVDAASGAVLVGLDTAPKVELPPGGQPALRNTVKNIHRMLAYGDIGVAVFMIVSLVLCAMVATGLVLYFRLLAARMRIGRRALFWSGGGWWRELHRALAIAASLFLVVVVGSGTLLAVGDLGVSIHRILHHGRPGMTADVSAPLTDAALAPMLRTTLAAFRAENPGRTIRVVRLRSFAGMPQGVVVTGGEDAEQFPYNAATGARASLFGPNYPATGQPFGWAEDQFVKGIHRGDFLGMPGRWISLATGIALLFLTISGASMYLDLWSRRRRAGRRGLFWR